MESGWQGIPARKRRVAEQRLMWLRLFWSAEREAPGVPRWKVAAEVVGAIKGRTRAAKISVKTMQTWERLYEEFGPMGLVDGRGRPATRRLAERGRAEEATALELIEEAYRLLRLAGRQLRAGEDS